MFTKLIGNEKAVIGGLSAGGVALLGQLGINGQMTLKEAIYALATWLVTHVAVYATTNTPVTKQPAPTVVKPAQLGILTPPLNVSPTLPTTPPLGGQA